MALLLPNKVWDIQTCSQCQKYLSYGPIELSSQGTVQLITCGRCGANEDIVTPSIYNIVAQQLVFPCVNRYEGCNKLLNFEDVPEHEDGCVGGQYICPLCTISNFKPESLLYLLKHYVTFHKKSILSTLSIHLPLNGCFEDSLIYHDDHENILVIIYIQFDSTQLKVNVSTVGDRIGRLKYRVRITKDHKQLFVTDFYPCTSFDNNIEAFSFEHEEISSNLLCNLEFDTSRVSSFLSLPLKNDIKDTNKRSVILEQYGTDLGPIFKDVDLKIRFPKVDISDLSLSLRDENGIYYFQNFKKVDNLKMDQDVYLFCSLCENYCFLEDIDIVLSCSKSCSHICKFCRNNLFLVDIPCVGTDVISICGICKQSFCKQPKYNFRSRIKYYCRYECKNFFNGDQLKDHEDKCYLNKLQYSDLQLAQIIFGEYFMDSSEESKTVICKQNTMLLDYDILQNRGKIYMITNTFHCLIFYEKDNQKYRFRIVHTYLPDKFYILIRLFHNGRTKENYNNFTVDVGQKAFFIVLLKLTKSYIKQERQKEKKKKREQKALDKQERQRGEEKKREKEELDRQKEEKKKREQEELDKQMQFKKKIKTRGWMIIKILVLAVINFYFWDYIIYYYSIYLN